MHIIIGFGILAAIVVVAKNVHAVTGTSLFGALLTGVVVVYGGIWLASNLFRALVNSQGQEAPAQSSGLRLGGRTGKVMLNASGVPEFPGYDPVELISAVVHLGKIKMIPSDLYYAMLKDIEESTLGSTMKTIHNTMGLQEFKKTVPSEYRPNFSLNRMAIVHEAGLLSDAEREAAIIQEEEMEKIYDLEHKGGENDFENIMAAASRDWNRKESL
ncbi:hypothetical protein FGK63_20320 [Ruegeria sediminis]|uniref:Uncharacterized protein n=1 Tax=Ruegeria sediminis TaxID=2583820 RepID=A0ABY2WSQ3_9RHOB|nr:hypothetical protein [Ruegeria sediminis]TMV02575.1 hypothetical protein FGK63_20320 [Ruegeria sediminis]